MKLILCDRCQKPMPDDIRDNILDLTSSKRRGIGMSSALHWDICVDCVSDLRAFMRNQAATDA